MAETKNSNPTIDDLILLYQEFDFTLFNKAFFFTWFQPRLYTLYRNQTQCVM